MQYNTCIIYSNSSIMKVISKRQQLAKETPNKVEKNLFVRRCDSTFTNFTCTREGCSNASDLQTKLWIESKLCKALSRDVILRPI